MLQTIGEWYKLTDPSPNDDVLDKRRTAAIKIADTWEKASSASALDLVSLALEIFSEERNEANSALKSVTASIVDAQPSFDAQGKNAATDIRICAAFALSEVLARQKGLSRKSLGPDVITANAIASALRFRSTGKGKYAADSMSSLLGVAEDLLDAMDTRRRARRENPLQKFQKMLAEEGATMATVGDALDLVYSEILKDREETQALWWVFGGYSYTTRRHFKDTTLGTAALLSGAELATIVSFPATAGISALSSRAVRVLPGADDPMSLKELLDTVDKAAWEHMASSTSASDFARRNSVVFPISHVAVRLKDATGSLKDILDNIPDWGPASLISPAGLGAQVFAERALLAQIEEQ